MVSAREKTRTKVSYIWDVTDPTGKRVNRITGEEVLTGAQAKDPWSSVNGPVVDTIANKTATSLATWLPTQGQAAVATSRASGDRRRTSVHGHAASSGRSGLRYASGGRCCQHADHGQHSS